MGTLGSFPGGPHEYRGLEAHGNLCILFKHWFRWKYQYNKYMFNFIDIFSFIPVSGCVVQPGAPVHCFARGGYYAVKMALPTILNVIKIKSLTCSPLLICCSVGDLRKPHYGSRVSDPRPEYHPMRMVNVRQWKCY
jgi:hypothetical protein